MRKFMRIFNIISLIFLAIFFIVTLIAGHTIGIVVSLIFIIFDIVDIVIHFNDF